MQIIQRFLSLLVMIVLLLIMPLLFQMDQLAREQYHQAESLIEGLSLSIEQKGELTYEEYLSCLEALIKLNKNRELIVYEYQREEGMDDSIHWYLVSWEEIEEILITKECYVFQNKSAYKIVSDSPEKATLWQRLMGTDEAIMYGGRIFR